MQNLSDRFDVDESRIPGGESLTLDCVRTCEASVKEFTCSATRGNTSQAISFVKLGIEEFGFSAKVQVRFAIITGEIFSNIAKFAYGPSAGDVTIRLSLQAEGRMVEVAFIDGGVAFNPLEAPRVDTAAAVANRQIGGQGIFLVRSLADRIEYERKNGKNILRVLKPLER